MNIRISPLALAAALAVALATAAACANEPLGDGTSGQLVAEPYEAFHSGKVGDFYTDPSEMAESVEPGSQRTQVASAPASNTRHGAA